jgi:hypothetical protein
MDRILGDLAAVEPLLRKATDQEMQPAIALADVAAKVLYLAGLTTGGAMTRQRRAPAEYTPPSPPATAAVHLGGALPGLRHYCRWPLEAGRSGQPGARGRTRPGPRGSGVVNFVPQLVRKTARRGDRLHSEAVFETA